jgi:hypothetical protein
MQREAIPKVKTVNQNKEPHIVSHEEKYLYTFPAVLSSLFG